MKKIIAVIIAVAALNFSASAEETTGEKLAAAKARQAELLKEIARLEKPTTKEHAQDMVILVKRQYNEVSSKVTSLTKELVEKLNKNK